MRDIGFYELSQYTSEARGQINKIYLHWTGCGYNRAFSEYHLNIMSDGTLITDMDSFMDIKKHTWRRNTGAIGIALACCNNDSYITQEEVINYGDEPPTEVQIDMMAKVVAKLCIEIGLTLDEVLTHAEVAYIDGYGLFDEDPDMRWDLYGRGEEIRERARGYMNDWGY